MQTFGNTNFVVLDSSSTMLTDCLKVRTTWIVSPPIPEKLEDDECLIMTGAEKYSNYSGYANSYKFESNHKDDIFRDPLSRKLTQVVAMDAIPYYDDPTEQYLMTNIIRDLNKSYVSFVSNNTNQSAIATGNWGCGAFCGNPHLKVVYSSILENNIIFSL